MRMRRIVLSYVACPAVPYFTILSHKRHDFRKKKNIEHKMCVWFSLQLSIETFLILRRIEWEMIKNVYWSIRYSCHILLKLDFSRQIFEKLSNVKFYEDPSSGSGAWRTQIATHHDTRHNTPIHNILSTTPQLSISQKALGPLPEDGIVMPKRVGATIHN
jgi:hypothetical protein